MRCGFRVREGRRRAVAMIVGFVSVALIVSIGCERKVSDARPAPPSVVKQKGWMSKTAYERKSGWTGRPHTRFIVSVPAGGKFVKRNVPAIENEPYIFLGSPTNCPTEKVGGWVTGAAIYWFYLVDRVPFVLLTRTDWGSVRATGNIIQTKYPRADNSCGVDSGHGHPVDWVEVDFETAVAAGNLGE